MEAERRSGQPVVFERFRGNCTYGLKLKQYLTLHVDY